MSFSTIHSQGFSLFQIDRSSDDWATFRPRPDRKSRSDDKLASAYYQFLLVSFGPLHDSTRWWVYPDACLFSKDAVFDRVEFLFNRTYKRAYGSKSSRVIRLVRPRDSHATDLIQLADVLLGTFYVYGAEYSSVEPSAGKACDLLQ